MRTIETTKEMQKIELDILRYIKQVCDENGLMYYLTYGTLIGAVRHKGFIPWDDDIDIFMPREDYYKLVEICKENPHEYYKIVSYETNKQFTNALPKMIDSRTLLIQDYVFIERVDLGVYVDIFVLDGLGNTYEEAIEYEIESRVVGRKWYRADTKFFPPRSKNKIKDVIRGIRNIPYKIKGITYYVNEINKYAEQKSFYDCEYVSKMNCATGNKPQQQIWKREWFGEGIQAEFEGELFRIPIDYDSFLKTQFGDYMKLPPEEERKGNHYYKAYWK